MYSVDVGRGQLDWKLRNDPRVVCMEKTNIRYLTPDQVPERGQLASIDVSFISLKLVLKPVRELIADGADIAALIKPQFEAGREKVGKKGVVRDRAVHEEVIENVMEYASEASLSVLGLDFSPITGPEGNIEYLVWLRKAPEGEAVRVPDKETAERVVTQAHIAHGR